jgi:hypothetical protein
VPDEALARSSESAMVHSGQINVEATKQITRRPAAAREKRQIVAETSEAGDQSEFLDPGGAYCSDPPSGGYPTC